MSEVIFYKDNGEELCRCLLEGDSKIIEGRKEEFKSYLQKRETPKDQKNKDSYIQQTFAFFKELASKNLLILTNDTRLDDNFMYRIDKLSILDKIYNSTSQDSQKNNGETISYRELNSDKFGRMVSACLKIYMEFLLEEQKHLGGIEDMQENREARIPLNQILYGPPGTGKTYRTIDKALEILKQFDPSLPLPPKEDRSGRKKLFDTYLKNKQIAFITFHQSYGYEEFVEGIKPNLESQENIIYKVEDGIFKEMCKRASSKEIQLEKATQIKTEKLNIITDTTKAWKISLGDKSRSDSKALRKYCFENDEIRIGWGEAPANEEKFSKLGRNNKSSIVQFSQEMEIGDWICVLNDQKTIQGIGIIESEMQQTPKKDQNNDHGFSLQEFQSYRKVQWIDKEEIINVFNLNNGKNLTRKTVYPLSFKVQDILDLLPESQNLQQKVLEDNTQKPYILIIDEINRGNVSKIFGELITLIEESKRIGAKEELKVTLPYSNDSFGVPKNLYIIGTMNTADRSITALDTALRRRFEFVEMMPKHDLLKDQKCGEINLQEMLKAINERIEFLLDREKTIGHTFFIGINTIEELKKVFQNKVIPLLQEYFYNDYACIQAVLNQAVLNSNKMIQEKKIKASKAFNDFIEERGLSEKVIYEIAPQNDPIWTKEETYKTIYQTTDNKNSSNENN